MFHLSRGPWGAPAPAAQFLRLLIQPRLSLLISPPPFSSSMPLSLSLSRSLSVSLYQLRGGGRRLFCSEKESEYGEKGGLVASRRSVIAARLDNHQPQRKIMVFFFFLKGNKASLKWAGEWVSISCSRYVLHTHTHTQTTPLILAASTAWSTVNGFICLICEGGSVWWWVQSYIRVEGEPGFLRESWVSMCVWTDHGCWCGGWWPVFAVAVAAVAAVTVK